MITTPPPQRVPIKTHLSEYSEEKVIAAINYELDRGGQVFYVLPRIQGKIYGTSISIHMQVIDTYMLEVATLTHLYV